MTHHRHYTKYRPSAQWMLKHVVAGLGLWTIPLTAWAGGGMTNMQAESAILFIGVFVVMGLPFLAEALLTSLEKTGNGVVVTSLFAKTLFPWSSVQAINLGTDGAVNLEIAQPYSRKILHAFRRSSDSPTTMVNIDCYMDGRTNDGLLADLQQHVPNLIVPATLLRRPAPFWQRTAVLGMATLADFFVLLPLAILVLELAPTSIALRMAFSAWIAGLFSSGVRLLFRLLQSQNNQHKPITKWLSASILLAPIIAALVGGIAGYTWRLGTGIEAASEMLSSGTVTRLGAVLGVVVSFLLDRLLNVAAGMRIGRA